MKQRDAEMIYVGFWTDKGTADQACLELRGRWLRFLSLIQLLLPYSFLLFYFYFIH